jgi:hypothetical protein
MFGIQPFRILQNDFLRNDPANVLQNFRSALKTVDNIVS